MKTIIVKHKDLDKFSMLCEICHIYPRVIKVYEDETELYLGPYIDVEHFSQLMEMFE